MKIATEIGKGWEQQFDRWFEPFLNAFPALPGTGVPALSAGPGGRNGIEPLVSRVAPGENQQVHHVVATSRWSTGPIEEVLTENADALVGGDVPTAPGHRFRGTWAGRVAGLRPTGRST